MKLEELTESVPTDSKQRQAQLKQLLLKGEVPTLAHASSSVGDYARGDLVNLGYMEKVKERHGNSSIEWYELTPKAVKDSIKFKMGGKLYGKGGLQKTDEMEIELDRD